MPQGQHPDHLGRYEIVRELGRGAMGVVYEGRDPKIGRRVAIKTARSDVIESTHDAHVMMERFLREARAAGVLNHPNIVTIYDVGEEGETAYIAMEYVEGGDLKDHLRKKGPAPPGEAAVIGAALCRALAHAHKHGIIHRDIKPSNVMLPDEGGLKIADFGIAHMQGSELTRDGSIVGTPYYLSPEGFMGKKVDHRADLFACGVILYELLTGQRPFQGDSMGAVMHQVLNQAPTPPCRLDAKIPAALSSVIMKALSKEPARRYADGNRMAEALEEAVKGRAGDGAPELDPDIEATVAMETVPENMASGPPPPQSAAEADTVVTPPPHKAGQATHSATATVPQGQEAPEESARTLPTGSTERRSRKPLAIAAAIVVPLVLAGVVAGFTLLGDEGNQTEEEGYWGSVEFHIEACSYEDPELNIPTDASVEVVDTQTQRTLFKGVVSSEAGKVVRFPSDARPKAFQYIVRKEGFEEVPGEPQGRPDQPGDKAGPLRVQLFPKI